MPICRGLLTLAAISSAFVPLFSQNSFTINTIFPNSGGSVPSGMARPYGVILDSSGNLYVADSQLNVVFRRTPAGVVTVTVGTGQASFSGDGGQAALATLSGPTGLAFDSSGNLLYIADSGNYRIRLRQPEHRRDLNGGWQRRQVDLLPRRWESGYGDRYSTDVPRRKRIEPAAVRTRRQNRPSECRWDHHRGNGRIGALS